MHPAVQLAFQVWGFLAAVALIFVALNNIIKHEPLRAENTPCRHYDPSLDDEDYEEVSYRAHA